jgi:addiction module RelE/StbE family toxin
MRLRASIEFRDDTKRYGKIKDYEDNLRIVLSTLELGNKIAIFPDQELEGSLKEFRECEFREGYVLLYKVEKEITLLVRAAPRYRVYDLDD